MRESRYLVKKSMPERFQASQGQFLETASICRTLLVQASLGYEELSALPSPVTLSDTVRTSRASKSAPYFEKPNEKQTAPILDFGFRISRREGFKYFFFKNPKSEIPNRSLIARRLLLSYIACSQFSSSVASIT